MRQHTLTRRHVLAGSAAALAATTAPRLARAAEPAVIRIGVQPSLSYTPLYVVKERGLIEKHAKALGASDMKGEWRSFSSGPVMNDSLLAGQLDIVCGGTSGGIIIWDKTRGKGPVEVKGVAAINSLPFYLFSSRPGVKSITDMGEQDRIAVPAAKSSMQAVLLQMAAAKHFGAANWAKFDPLTVSMAHPDAYALLSSGKTELNAHFSGPPYQYDQLKDPKLTKVLDSTDITNGPMTLNMIWSTARFHDASPIAYKVFLAAFEEGMDITRTDPKSAAQHYVANVKSKVDLAEVLQGLTDPGTKFSSSPQRSATMAQFLHSTGVVKNRMDDWKDFYFPEMHAKGGS
jgi:NitT/TauT family transport system substrate-binding protein